MYVCLPFDASQSLWMCTIWIDLVSRGCFLQHYHYRHKHCTTVRESLEQQALANAFENNWHIRERSGSEHQNDAFYNLVYTIPIQPIHLFFWQRQENRVVTDDLVKKWKHMWSDNMLQIGTNAVYCGWNIGLSRCKEHEPRKKSGLSFHWILVV